MSWETHGGIDARYHITAQTPPKRPTEAREAMLAQDLGERADHSRSCRCVLHVGGTRDLVPDCEAFSGGLPWSPYLNTVTGARIWVAHGPRTSVKHQNNPSLYSMHGIYASTDRQIKAVPLTDQARGGSAVVCIAYSSPRARVWELVSLGLLSPQEFFRNPPGTHLNQQTGKEVGQQPYRV